MRRRHHQPVGGNDHATGRSVADFGYRRAQDPYLATRSAIIGGCASTSYVAGAAHFGARRLRRSPAARLPGQVSSWRT